jgi:soluble lytic murein transglycosylase-like protein
MSARAWATSSAKSEAKMNVHGAVARAHVGRKKWRGWRGRVDASYDTYAKTRTRRRVRIRVKGGVSVACE